MTPSFSRAAGLPTGRLFGAAFALFAAVALSSTSPILQQTPAAVQPTPAVRSASSATVPIPALNVRHSDPLEAPASPSAPVGAPAPLPPR